MYRGDEPLPADASDEEATDFFVSLLRDKRQPRKYGYQVYLPSIVDEYLYSVTELPRNEPVAAHWREALSPVFLSAAWSLRRLGVLRPGVERFD